jgi:hypothetical protein
MGHNVKLGGIRNIRTESIDKWLHDGILYHGAQKDGQKIG